MMKIYLLTLMITFTMLLYFIKNPLNMGLMILIQSLIICILMTFFLNFFWLSYILYLIMLGGILILFMYMCSIASNKIILFNINLMMLLVFIFMILILSLSNIKWMSMNLMEMDKMNNFFSNEMINMSKMYNNMSFKISIMLIIYLFLLLFMVTMLTNSNKGPLRISILN
uniref:NADH-ubiquinone oxidoreductase chain 6 n=1 Tax=Hydropsyche fryeri TaxID=1875497 RepID=A0A8A9WFJ8_9NEOP|nr:NADH dehydrogenase subunit 6 [Hydropsyche fryeri]QTT57962.1 NADH dehydrogenase subunit 6 [Hydropsyche fryeri]